MRCPELLSIVISSIFNICFQPPKFKLLGLFLHYLVPIWCKKYLQKNQSHLNVPSESFLNIGYPNFENSVIKTFTPLQMVCKGDYYILYIHSNPLLNLMCLISIFLLFTIFYGLKPSKKLRFFKGGDGGCQGNYDSMTIINTLCIAFSYMLPNRFKKFLIVSEKLIF